MKQQPIVILSYQQAGELAWLLHHLEEVLTCEIDEEDQIRDIHSQLQKARTTLDKAMNTKIYPAFIAEDKR